MSNVCYEFPNIDMEMFYREALKLNKFAGIPQILIVKDLAANKNALRYTLPGAGSIICLKYNKNTLKNLKAELKKSSATAEAAPDSMVHSLTEEQMGYLITFGIKTCNMLRIACPQFAFCDNLEVNSKSLLESNVVSLKTEKENLLLMLRYMFHELRVLWQAKNHTEYLADNMSEIDAEAFAAKLFKAITGSDTVIDSADYAGGAAAVKVKVLEQAEAIELDEGTVELFKAMIEA